MENAVLNLLEKMISRNQTHDLLLSILPVVTFIVGLIFNRICERLDWQKKNDKEALTYLYTPLRMIGLERIGYNRTSDDLPINEASLNEVKEIIKKHGHYMSKEALDLYIRFIDAENENAYFMEKTLDNVPGYHCTFNPTGDYYLDFQMRIDKEYDALVKKSRIKPVTIKVKIEKEEV